MVQFLLGKTVVFTFKVKTWSITKKTPPKDLALRKQLFPNVYKKSLLKDTLKAFNDLETSNKSVSSNVFWYVKYAYSESVFNALYIEIKHKHWDKTQTVFFGKNKRYQKCLLLSFTNSNHHSFTFNLRSL